MALSGPALRNLTPSKWVGVATRRVLEVSFKKQLPRWPFYLAEIESAKCKKVEFNKILRRTRDPGSGWRSKHSTCISETWGPRLTQSSGNRTVWIDFDRAQVLNEMNDELLYDFKRDLIEVHYMLFKLLGR